jgi:hypothetical protein
VIRIGPADAVTRDAALGAAAVMPESMKCSGSRDSVRPGPPEARSQSASGHGGRRVMISRLLWCEGLLAVDTVTVTSALMTTSVRVCPRQSTRAAAAVRSAASEPLLVSTVIRAAASSLLPFSESQNGMISGSGLERGLGLRSEARAS